MSSIQNVNRRYLWGGVLGIATLCAIFLGINAARAKSAIKPPSGLWALGQPVTMPSFNLPTVAGGMLDSASLQGKVVIVRFWATW